MLLTLLVQHSNNISEIRGTREMGYTIYYKTGKLFQKQASVLRSKSEANIALYEIPRKYA
jgi:hypothetical protein